MQVIEETKAEAFMTAKVDDPTLRREQMAIDLRKSKKKELLTKKRYPGLNQDQSFIQAPEEFFEFPEGAEEQDFGLDEVQETFTVSQYMAGA